jgi:hypothetical protein
LNPLLDQLASPKMSPPIVRLVSRVTVRPAVMSMVLKFASDPAPLAMVPPAQLPAVPHVPLASFVHVPSAARAVTAPNMITVKTNPNAIALLLMTLLPLLTLFTPDEKPTHT